MTTYLEAQPVATAFGMQQHDTSQVVRLLRQQVVDAHGMDISTTPAPSGALRTALAPPAWPGFLRARGGRKTGVLRDLGAETAGRARLA